ncbi:hypothetical protein QTP86_027624 [Hemibagrus guttatus]|nr:hypothetical protein QTP86_027624 [Hemibagrus guttatus]
MDLLGLLPKSAQGHEYILVMMDYATRYPEVVPLRKATSRNIARKLRALFSRVEIPKNILTDQENVTLVVDEEGRNWDLLLPYVLCAIQETPQASTGFTPFELLFRWRPRGLLDVAREDWEGQHSPFRFVTDYVQNMQVRIG